jgi:hypothetical protein
MPSTESPNFYAELEILPQVPGERTSKEIFFFFFLPPTALPRRAPLRVNSFILFYFFSLCHFFYFFIFFLHQAIFALFVTEMSSENRPSTLSWLVTGGPGFQWTWGNSLLM